MKATCMNQIQLAVRWGISHRTLERWRWTGEGPKFLKVGGRVVYRLSDVEEYEQSIIRDRLGQAAGKEKAIEVKFSIPDMWSRQLFVALCRRYGLHPFRYRRMHRQTIIIRAPESFIEQLLWPEFEELSAALTAYLSEITERVIREEVHGETGEADEVDEPRRIGL